MLDGIQDNANYPPDFFIDFVFGEVKTDETSEKEKENKNKVWKIIAQTCAERRKISEEENIGETKKEESKKTAPEEEKKAFVIDSPGLTPKDASKEVEELKKAGYSLDEERKADPKKAAVAPAPAARNSPPKVVLGELE